MGPAQTDILARDKLHKGGLVLKDLFLGERLGSQALGKDGLNLIGGSRDIHNVIECVVGGAAAQLVGNIVALEMADFMPSKSLTSTPATSERCLQ